MPPASSPGRSPTTAGSSTPPDAVTLLRLELETLWITDAAGRIVRSRDERVPNEPLLVIASCGDGLVWSTSSALSTEVDQQLRPVVDRCRPGTALGWAPDEAATLAALVEAAARHPLWKPLGGPSWVVPRGRAFDVSPADVRTSADAELREIAVLLPEADRALTAPWAVAMLDGRVASVCETARDAPAAVEAGVWTYEPHRRRGLAAAATAAWAALVADRTAFYSTGWDNTGSQAVARRLGLEPLGQWWQLVRRE